jgi:transposase InsO family protein
MDDFNRELLAMETDLSLLRSRLIRVLEYLKESREIPQMIRVDNGPEFISNTLDVWCKDNIIELVFIQPGKPMQNGFIVRCKNNVRLDFLNAYVFKILEEVRSKPKSTCPTSFIIVLIKLLTLTHQLICWEICIFANQFLYGLLSGKHTH